ncbi:MAG TPA: RCC1 domain-containing protein, partial [Gemmatimonadales bacterium]|nr:RCC1 domain-containing protein [Gemmatimonadales bacterium]
ATITAGSGFWCGLRDDGTPVCWGSNARGQLGDETTTPRPIPTPISGVPPLVRIVAGFTGACGLTSSGDVWCWGQYFRQGAERTPIRLLLGEPVVRMDVNDTDVFLTLSGGRLRYFHLGVERPLSWVGNLGDLTSTRISGRESICVTTTSGEVHCSATLSNGIIASQLTPSELVPVPPP